jgi:bifunctional non-homologous end joining protein LigD
MTPPGTDPAGHPHYAGGVGTGFSDQQLQAWRQTLDGMAAAMPPGVLVAGEPLDPSIRWVQPDLVVEVQFVGWSGSGRVRHAVFLGLRADKAARQVIRDIADPDAPRWMPNARLAGGTETTPAARSRPKVAVPPRRRA